MPTDPTIVSIAGGDLARRQLEQVEAIFFDASGRTFELGPERDAFRERWLGRFMRGGSDVVLLALTGDAVAGYLVGAVHDPAEQERFTDIGYFRGDFRDLCRAFPAHLHINLAPAFRSRGIGAGLIEAFANHAVSAGAPGLHVVTAETARNISFYERCGLSHRATTTWNGRRVVFLGRTLGPPALAGKS